MSIFVITLFFIASTISSLDFDTSVVSPPAELTVFNICYRNGFSTVAADTVPESLLILASSFSFGTKSALLSAYFITVSFL
jgi:hypothetical protein